MLNQSFTAKKALIDSMTWASIYFVMFNKIYHFLDKIIQQLN